MSERSPSHHPIDLEPPKFRTQVENPIFFSPNHSLLRAMHYLNRGVMFDKVQDIAPGITIGISDIISSNFWNTALVPDLPNLKTHLGKIEKTFWDNRVLRQPSIYFEEKEDAADITAFLKDRNYNIEWRDSWMVWNGGFINYDSLTNDVDIASRRSDIASFVRTFEASHQTEGLANPYGPLSMEYKRALMKIWNRGENNYRLQYRLLYDQDAPENWEPVAVSMYTTDGILGLVSSVGVLPNYRNQGYGREATLLPIASHQNILHSQDNPFPHSDSDRLIIALTTEPGSYTEAYFEKLGFRKLFIAKGMTRNGIYRL